MIAHLIKKVLEYNFHCFCFCKEIDCTLFPFFLISENFKILQTDTVIKIANTV